MRLLNFYLSEKYFRIELTRSRKVFSKRSVENLWECVLFQLDRCRFAKPTKNLTPFDFDEVGNLIYLTCKYPTRSARLRPKSDPAMIDYFTYGDIRFSIPSCSAYDYYRRYAVALRRHQVLKVGKWSTWSSNSLNYTRFSINISQHIITLLTIPLASVITTV